MADLDDFFAKKDRKKSKNVKKFATADEVAKKLEDTKKADKVIKKDRQGSNQEGDETGTPAHVRILRNTKNILNKPYMSFCSAILYITKINVLIIAILFLSV